MVGKILFMEIFGSVKRFFSYISGGARIFLALGFKYGHLTSLINLH